MTLFHARRSHFPGVSLIFPARKNAGEPTSNTAQPGQQRAAVATAQQRRARQVDGRARRILGARPAARYDS
jgi:hypothetical protein